MRRKPTATAQQESAANAARTYRHTLLLNEHEQNALERYCTKYHVSNKSKLIREVLMRTILAQFEEDHPTLF